MRKDKKSGPIIFITENLTILYLAETGNDLQVNILIMWNAASVILIYAF